MPEYSEQDLKYAAEFREEIHREALAIVRKTRPTTGNVPAANSRRRNSTKRDLRLKGTGKSRIDEFNETIIIDEHHHV